MSRRYFDAYGGLTEYFHYDESSGRFAIESVSDVGPQLDRNKNLKTASDGYSPSREFKRVASIPAVVHLLWIERYGVDPLIPGNEDLLRRLLNSSEWMHLRTSEGVV